MFKSNHKGRYLALSLALALGGTFGGAVFGSVTEAADVTINVLPPPDENKIPDIGDGDGIAAAIAAGDEEVAENHLTVNTVIWAGNAYGAYTAGDGQVRGNTLTLQNGVKITKDAALNGGSAGGGLSLGAGDVIGNTAVLSNGVVESSLFGGHAMNGNAIKNHVTLSAGTAKRTYGGRAEGIGKDAVKNTVEMTGGTVDERIIGGFASKGNATENRVTLSGGKVKKDVYGGLAHGDGNDAVKNIVEMTGGTVEKNLWGGRQIMARQQKIA